MWQLFCKAVNAITEASCRGNVSSTLKTESSPKITNLKYHRISSNCEEVFFANCMVSSPNPFREKPVVNLETAPTQKRTESSLSLKSETAGKLPKPAAKVRVTSAVGSPSDFSSAH